jgi:D-arabinose 1-dehydrogenase-like Zn-dependent alcohol dehydrogenase
MRAMQIIEWGKPLETREYPDPEPQGEEVLLRVEAAGVCHSDVHIWDGYFDLGDERRISLESRGVHLPFTMGHEIAGEVAALDHRGRSIPGRLVLPRGSATAPASIPPAAGSALPDRR